MWKPWIAEGARLKYLGIVEALETDIRSGRISGGERLPSQRVIAETIDVDLTTVTRACNEARRRGFVSAQAGRGTFVRDHLAEKWPEAQMPVLDLSMNIAPQPSNVDFRKMIPEGISAILNGPRGGLSLQYQESSGALPDRAVASRWLATRHGEVQADRVAVAAGAQSALFALCMLLAAPGDHIAAGEMTYPGLRAAAQQRGIVLDPIRMDENGIIPDDFRRLCAARRPKALYVVPNIDNPTTATLPADRRAAIVSIARDYGVTIIEDDPYGSLRRQTVASFLSLAPDVTWHIATLSKCVTPALRVAFVVAPDALCSQQLSGVLRASVMIAPPLFVALASRWINEGILDEIATAICEENTARQQIAARIFHNMTYAADPEGHHLWLKLPPHWQAREFAEHADRSGISIVPDSAFSIGSQLENRVRISLGVAPDRDLLEEGLVQLASMMDMPFLSRRAVV